MALATGPTEEEEEEFLTQEFGSAGNDFIYLFLLLIFNKIMNFLVQKKPGICCLIEQLTALQIGLCSKVLEIYNVWEF